MPFGEAGLSRAKSSSQGCQEGGIYPPDIRTAIYTTNSVESLNRSLRKIIKTRDGFPNEEAALKLLFLALRQAAKKWTMPIHHWREALNHFTILWPDRMPALERTAQ